MPYPIGRVDAMYRESSIRERARSEVRLWADCDKLQNRWFEDRRCLWTLLRISQSIYWAGCSSTSGGLSRSLYLANVRT